MSFISFNAILPPKLEYTILESLSPASLRLVGMVNKHFKSNTRKNSLWRPHLSRDFPNHKYSYDTRNCFKVFSILKRLQFIEMKEKNQLLPQIYNAIEENDLDKINLLLSQVGPAIFEIFFDLVKMGNRDLFFQQIIGKTPPKNYFEGDAAWKKGILNVEENGELMITHLIPSTLEGGNLILLKQQVKEFNHHVFNLALLSGSPELVKRCLQNYTPSQIELKSAAIYAAEAGHLAILKILFPLLEQHPDDILKEGKLSASSIECICYLVSQGANINTQCKSKKYPCLASPICFAIEAGSLHAVKFLLSKGADLNFFPLKLAIELSNQQPDFSLYDYQKIIKLLIVHGAQVKQIHVELADHPAIKAMLKEAVTPLSYQQTFQSYAQDMTSWKGEKKVKLFGEGNQAVFCPWETAAMSVTLQAQKSFLRNFPFESWILPIVDLFHKHIVSNLLQKDAALVNELQVIFSFCLGALSYGPINVKPLENLLPDELLSIYRSLNGDQYLKAFLEDVELHSKSFNVAPLSKRKIVVCSADLFYLSLFSKNAVETALQSMGYSVVPIKSKSTWLKSPLSRLGMKFPNNTPVNYYQSEKFFGGKVTKFVDATEDCIVKHFQSTLCELIRIIQVERPALVIDTRGYNLGGIGKILNIPILSLSPKKSKKETELSFHLKIAPISQEFYQTPSEEIMQQIKDTYQISNGDIVYLFVIQDLDILKKFLQHMVSDKPHKVIFLQGKNDHFKREVPKILEKFPIPFQIIESLEKEKLNALVHVISEQKGEIWHDNKAYSDEILKGPTREWVSQLQNKIEEILK